MHLFLELIGWLFCSSHIRIRIHVVVTCNATRLRIFILFWFRRRRKKNTVLIYWSQNYGKITFIPNAPHFLEHKLYDYRQFISLKWAYIQYNYLNLLWPFFCSWYHQSTGQFNIKLEVIIHLSNIGGIKHSVSMLYQRIRTKIKYTRMSHGPTIPSIHHHDVTHFGVKRHTMKQTETHTIKIRNL